MKGWILYKGSSNELKSERHEIDRFLEVAENEGIKLRVVAPEDLELVVSSEGNDGIFLDDQKVELPDFFLPRMGAHTTYFGLAVIRQMERLGVFTINSSTTINNVRDKLFAHQLLAQNNLPVPKTMLVKFPIDVELVEETFGFPVVIKTISGTHGTGVYLSESKSKFQDLMNFVEGTNKNLNIVLQQYIASSRGRDLRVFTIGGRAVACMERKAPEGEFKANFSQGASVSEVEITSEIEWLATETARILNLDIGGIDLLFDEEHFMVCEANTAPGFRGIESCCNVNIPKEIFEYIRIRLGMVD